MTDKLTHDELKQMNGYLTWMVEAEAGDAITYAIGFLPMARTKRVTRKIARAMLEAYGQGIVELTQRRTGPFVYEYIATKRKEKRPPTFFCLPPLEGELLAA